MVEPSGWMRQVAADPAHSTKYADRFRRLAASGADVVGEARLVDAMAPRGARILDAGSGGGRIGGHLHRLGHTVVGVDVDPVLVRAAEEDHPGPTWITGDLAELDLPAHGILDPFDVVVSAGNVVAFLAPSTRRDVLARLRKHTAPEGRVVIGYGEGRGYPFTEVLADAEAAGLVPDVLLSTWDLRPFRTDSPFLVAVLRPA
ncbi:class I SAM-dependent methyltransferase [Ornithinimicrobium sp. F0845]|uniref:class I SAM-dependent methyltransferase n=1 Tax=Ornithinimicrobium sp. F0845 TaxID=2926412 RepID=UPI001FF65580|nr:class I SAM-dependent methyltransferase [Ornithinimicrobium sp. F0845]MCK0110729.1 class I SAM-dependent methyltransferase [Ornithinimicrobium sp. F0845]